jgi:hypothetical protein
MKPCAKNRQPIAWLAMDALSAQQAAPLRDHLARCEGCRRYWEEISSVTAELAAAAPESDLEASERFHRRVAEKLQAVQSSSVLSSLAAWCRGWRLNWRVALPAPALLLLVLGAIVALRYPPALFRPTAPSAQGGSAAAMASAPAPTLANYQMAASQSLEKFSDLLTRQGNSPLPRAPLMTASTLELANAP